MPRTWYVYPLFPTHWKQCHADIQLIPWLLDAAALLGAESRDVQGNLLRSYTCSDQQWARLSTFEQSARRVVEANACKSLFPVPFASSLTFPLDPTPCWIGYNGASRLKEARPAVSNHTDELDRVSRGDERSDLRSRSGLRFLVRDVAERTGILLREQDEDEAQAGELDDEKEG